MEGLARRIASGAEGQPTMDVPTARSELRQFALRHPYALAALAGVFAALGFAPGFDLLVIALYPFVLLIWLLFEAGTKRRAFLIAWAFGLTHFTVGLNWIATAFTYQAEMPAWLGWIAVVLLSVYLAVYPALAGLGAWWIARGRPAAFVLSFAGLWIVTEWMRGWLFTGFPWNPLSSMTVNNGMLPHLTRYIGTYGLSGLLLVVPGMIAMQNRPFEHRRMFWALLAATVAIFVLLFVPKNALGDPLPEAGSRIAIVQPNIGQDIANDAARYEEFFQRMARLSQPDPGAAPFDMIFWPEGAIPDYLQSGYPRRFYMNTTYGASAQLARARLGDIASGGLLITGSQDLLLEDDRLTGARNTVTVVSPDGDRIGNYAKAHLVPYGEYLPMRGLLEPIGLSRLVAGSLDFEPGPGPRSLPLAGEPKMGVQICYEIVFSGHVVDEKDRPDFIFNPSNDGWFGTWGPPQHLAQARMRAIEEGLPLVRSTTTGISALVDADGRVLERLEPGETARIDAILPPPHVPTPFSRFGNWLAILFAGLLIAGGIATARRAR